MCRLQYAECGLIYWWSTSDRGCVFYLPKGPCYSAHTKRNDTPLRVFFVSWISLAYKHNGKSKKGEELLMTVMTTVFLEQRRVLA